ncbi:WW domain [Plasmopara halstedii]|uniref:WW domain n=1 Tax=Plasmopara halstedii TaxID=4781 RepID=A0A0P1AAL9_PLAHL|nr:WW domain [Plasmopara halstedii]CEG37287.1 WW domain [Plasmopara halstedii]|eukprot:XP_024573656.1 WW domain [Plasmopara halstedii]
MTDRTFNGAHRRWDEDVFGWQLFHDRRHNLVYYLHSYTGEVRWPRPETVGFVMHGLKPLPAQAIDTRCDTNVVNPDIWSPYYPHVVMLPSGLVQVHPGSESNPELRCGYNRFPLKGSSVSLDHNTQRVRMLPPTWETSRNELPFLPPYPVAILGQNDKENKSRFASTACVQRPHETTYSRSYLSLQTGEFGQVLRPMDWSSTLRFSSTITPFTVRKQSAYLLKGPSSIMKKKEHNRKGYLLRLARKQMRDNNSDLVASASNSSATILTRQRWIPRIPTSPRARNKLPDLVLVETQENENE